jgi:anti-sigma B factor antagonist
MSEAVSTFDMRELGAGVRAIDIRGDITGASEEVLMDAYSRANQPGLKSVVLNFTDLEYMNSGGIGLLVTLLVGLSEHYQQIFELTRLDEAVGIHATEVEAVAAAGVSGEARR